MKITISLPLIKMDATFSDDTIRYGKGSRIELWHTDEMKSLAENMKTAGDIFFQDNLDLDESFLTNIGLDAYNTTFEFVDAMFSDKNKVVALQQHLKVRFDEIEPEYEPKVGAHIYDVDGEEYGVYYNSEVIESAKELHIDYMMNSSIQDVIGDIQYIEDFLPAIDIKAFAKAIRKKVEDDELQDFMPDDAWESDTKMVLWMVKEDEDFFMDNLEKYFNYDKMAELDINTVDEALVQVGQYSEHIFTGTPNGTDKKLIHIFKRY